MNALKRLTDYFAQQDIRTVAVVDLQWGDAGKGKLVDWLSEWAHVVARGTGGANAGHTITIGNQSHVFQLIPSGILREGKINVIGRGVAADPRVLAREIGTLTREGIACDGLRISRHARLVLPIDIALDQLRESGKKSTTIGTTGRGIGPVYESQVARIGLCVNDLLNADMFAQKLAHNLASRIDIFRQCDPQLVERILHGDSLERGLYWKGARRVFDIDAIIEQYQKYAVVFSDLITDTDCIVRDAVKARQHVLLEGAQGVLLSVDYGSYPFVTSSDASLLGLAVGVGLRTEQVDYCMSIAKAPYMSRVGKGPFPTEMGGDASERWCNEVSMTREKEARKYRSASINASDSFEQGIAIRRVGNEYGVNTGRLRRVGWLDIPLLRHALQYGGKLCEKHQGKIALTKLDVLNECDVIKLCVSYCYDGDEYRVGNVTLKKGDVLSIADMDLHVLTHCSPLYMEFPGWRSDLSQVKSRNDVPDALMRIIRVIERTANVRVDVLSVGPDRDETIVLC